MSCLDSLAIPYLVFLVSLERTAPLSVFLSAKSFDILPYGWHIETCFLFNLDLAGADDRINMRDKLKKLISRRPPIEELEKKGIIQGELLDLILEILFSFFQRP